MIFMCRKNQKSVSGCFAHITSSVK